MSQSDRPRARAISRRAALLRAAALLLPLCAGVAVAAEGGSTRVVSGHTVFVDLSPPATSGAAAGPPGEAAGGTILLARSTCESRWLFGAVTVSLPSCGSGYVYFVPDGAADSALASPPRVLDGLLPVVREGSVYQSYLVALSDGTRAIAAAVGPLATDPDTGQGFNLAARVVPDDVQPARPDGDPLRLHARPGPAPVARAP